MNRCLHTLTSRDCLRLGLVLHPVYDSLDVSSDKAMREKLKNFAFWVWKEGIRPLVAWTLRSFLRGLCPFLDEFCNRILSPLGSIFLVWLRNLLLYSKFFLILSVWTLFLSLSASYGWTYCRRVSLGFQAWGALVLVDERKLDCCVFIAWKWQPIFIIVPRSRFDLPPSSRVAFLNRLEMMLAYWKIGKSVWWCFRF